MYTNVTITSHWSASDTWLTAYKLITYDFCVPSNDIISISNFVNKSFKVKSADGRTNMTTATCSYLFWKEQTRRSTFFWLFLSLLRAFRRITQYHTPTNAPVYHVFKISLKTFTLKYSYCSDMFRQHIAYHPQGALMVLVKITIKHEHSVHMETRTEHTAHTDPWYAATPLTPLECSYYSDFS